MGDDGAAGQHRRSDCDAGHLTTREVQILHLAAAGLCSSMIARQLGISPRTVDDHFSVMRQRAEVADRGALIARGYAAGILVGWPPRWSGRCCLLVGTPGAQPQRVSENPAGNPNCPKTSDSPFLDTSGDRYEEGASTPHGDCAGDRNTARTTSELIGYARVYTRDQSLDRQIEALRAAGCSRIFTDKKPRMNTEGPGLLRLLHYARRGDVVVVTSLDRLSGSLQDLILLAVRLHCCGVEFKALHENLDTTTPDGQLFGQVFAVLAEFLQEHTHVSSHEGLAAARARRSVGGRPSVMTAQKIAAARALLPEKSIAAIARQLGVSRSTLYTHMQAITAAR